MARKAIPLILRADETQIQRELRILLSCRSQLITGKNALNDSGGHDHRIKANA